MMIVFSRDFLLVKRNIFSFSLWKAKPNKLRDDHTRNKKSSIERKAAATAAAAQKSEVKKAIKKRA